MTARATSESAQEQALRRLTAAGATVGNVYLDGERDPRRDEVEELEAACIEYARATRAGNGAVSL